MKSPVVKRGLLFIISLPLFCNKITAQAPAVDSAFYQQAVSNTIIVYQQLIGDQARIFNGIQYSGYPFSFAKGHPYFDSDVFSNGTIVYDNVLYPNVQLLYDELSDAIIIHLSMHKVQLSSERIAGFSLFDKKFIRITKDTASSSPISKEGFYQLVYEGNVTVLKREVKTVLDELSSSEGILRYIIPKQYYFIKKQNGYYPVYGKKEVLEIYSDRKKDVREYIKNNGLSFKKGPESMLAVVSAYYDQLTKKD
ncbi:hypothetical protein [Flavihumibacter fluvii]|uniref:hypothetical protein n=1 Tax=Flavihumibacter fluvii TaxID=2838157 RepID=UPI001BDF2CFA|nr:hypothetical protein [Flavihumibacter fluvii]ULQ50738.1 hypothetical protein KJS93_11660 [Flavihumibacter fluvii]